MPGGVIRIETIENVVDFEKLREEWDAVLKASASGCLFLTWDWLHTWWKHLSDGRQLFIITARCDGELVAIAPLALRPRRLSRLLPVRSLGFLGTGSVGSNYLDVIIRHGKEQEALQAMTNYLVRGKLMLELAELRGNSSFAAMLAAQLRRRGWRIREAQSNVSPFIKLSEHSWQSYLATLGAEHRYNFQRRLRNLTKEFDVRFERVLTEEQQREALASLVTLHNLRWRDRGGSSALHTPSLQAFHEEMSRLALERGWLRLFILRLDGQPAAALYGFRYRRTFYFYQSGFDPNYSKYSVGLVTMGLAIKSALEEGAEEYDFLGGDERYKFHWARDVRELRRLELYPPGARGWLFKGVMVLRQAARRMARRILPDTIVERIAAGRGIGVWKEFYAACSR
ncbi:MAG TPA: GNAT family N-acetyltransferase [Candidatus Binatia bacterium]|jgi:CelD/BcsL family acetyltransferase involved in cellulose biosynthesis|nr:GNAT family N-acetyltransferase [Candidatus Binatia bacterium]